MNIIIHFDDGTALEHFGVPGMKWGVRKAKDLIKTGLRELKPNVSSIRNKLFEQASSDHKANKGKAWQDHLFIGYNNFKKGFVGSSPIGKFRIDNKVIKQLAKYERNQKVKSFFKNLGKTSIDTFKNKIKKKTNGPKYLEISRYRS